MIKENVRSQQENGNQRKAKNPVAHSQLLKYSLASIPSFQSSSMVFSANMKSQRVKEARKKSLQIPEQSFIPSLFMPE